MIKEEDFQCSICQEILDDPYGTPCCGECFCKKCIKEWLNKNKTCPHCRKEIKSFDKCSANQKINRVLKGLPSECPNIDLGCDAKLTRGIIEDHLKICEFQYFYCSNSILGCEKIIMKKDFSSHINNCEYQKIECDLCSKEMFRNEKKFHQENECLEYAIDCNLKCGTKVKRKISDYLIHRSQCPEEPIICIFGCNENILRKEMDDHLQNKMKIHLANTYNIIKKLTNKNRNLSEIVNRNNFSIQQNEKSIQMLHQKNQ